MYLYFYSSALIMFGRDAMRTYMGRNGTVRDISVKQGNYCFDQDGRVTIILRIVEFHYSGLYDVLSLDHQLMLWQLVNLKLKSQITY